MKRKILCLILALLMAVGFVTGADILSALPEALAAEEEDGEWIGAWGSGMTNISFEDYASLYPSFMETAVRIILTPTASGEKLRLKISNVYGKKDLVITGMAVAKSDSGFKVKALGQYFAFNNGKAVITVPAGKEIYTDPIDFKVTAQEPIAVTFYVKDWQDITTVGLSGGKTYIALNQDVFDAFEDFLLPDGNFFPIPLSTSSLGTFLPSLKMLPSINVVPFLSGIDVLSTEKDPYSVVVIGDSTVANEFPYYLSKILASESCTNVGIVGKGIFGNSLLTDGLGTFGRIYGPSLLNRMDTDVLKQSGVRYVFVKIGANDITHPESESIKNYYGGPYSQPTADDIIEGFTEFINRCHNADIKVIASSITQWKDATRNYFGTNDNEYTFKQADWNIALKVNEWMKNTDLLDGFIDYASISANANDPAKLKGVWTSDFIHPNDTAQQEWAKAFPLDYIDIKTVPKGISLLETQITLPAGKTHQLEEIISPATASKTDVSWSSTNTSIVTVDQNGLVKAHKNGTATVTCTTVNGLTAKCKVTVATPTTGVSLNNTSLSLFVTQTEKLTATVKPTEASNKAVVWTSSNESVATVTQKGSVTALKEGTAVISCTTKDTGVVGKCNVTVKKKVAVTGVTLNATQRNMYCGGKYRLTATVKPSNASVKTLKWKSSNTSVAVVSTDGLVTAVKNGTANIYATSEDGKYSAICKITVKTAVKGVSLPSTKSIYVGNTVTLTPTFNPTNASNKNVTWRSNNTKVATVSAKGVVTGKATGTATITVTTNDGSFKAQCKVTVKKFVSVKSVSLAKTKSIYVGDKITLTPTITPSNASNKNCTWSSSDTSVATVSSTGVVTAKKAGYTNITCKTANGGYKATCKVTVKKAVSLPNGKGGNTNTDIPTATGTKVKGVKMNVSKVTLSKNKTYQLKATIVPSTATNKNVTWSSSNTAIVTVSSKGLITAKKAGTAYIYVKTKDGGWKSTCTVTVK